jgi:hypothetical protein
MASSEMLLRLALVRTDVSEELSASFIRVLFLRSVRRLLFTASVVPTSPIFVTRRCTDVAYVTALWRRCRSYVRVVTVPSEGEKWKFVS